MGLHILSLSADQELALLRQKVLEAAGHRVVTPRTEKEAEDAASGERFDVAVICHRMWPGTVRRLMRVFREHNPQGQFLVMVAAYGEVPELEGDRYVVGADGPDALLSVLEEMRSAPEVTANQHRS